LLIKISNYTTFQYYFFSLQARKITNVQRAQRFRSKFKRFASLAFFLAEFARNQFIEHLRDYETNSCYKKH